MFTHERLRESYIKQISVNGDMPNISLLRGSLGIYDKVYDEGDDRVLLKILEEQLGTATDDLQVKVAHTDFNRLNPFYAKGSLTWVQTASQYSVDITFSNKDIDPLVKRLIVPSILPGGCINTGTKFAVETLVSDADLSFSSNKVDGSSTCFLRTSKQKFSIYRKKVVNYSTEILANNKQIIVKRDNLKVITTLGIKYTNPKKGGNIYRPLFSIAGFIIASKGFITGLAMILNIDPSRIRLKPIDVPVEEGYTKYMLKDPVDGCIEPIPPKWAYHIANDDKAPYKANDVVDCLWVLGYVESDISVKDICQQQVALGIVSAIYKPSDANSTHRLLLKLEQMKKFINKPMIDELKEIYPGDLLRDINVTGKDSDPMTDLWVAILTTSLWKAAPVLGNAEHLKRITTYENLTREVLTSTNRALISSLSTLNPSPAKNKNAIKMAFSTRRMFGRTPFLTYSVATPEHVLGDVLTISLQTPEGGPSLHNSSNVKMPGLLDIDPTVFLTRSPALGLSAPHRWIANPYMTTNGNKVTYSKTDALIIEDLAEGIGFDLNRYPLPIRPCVFNAGK